MSDQAGKYTINIQTKADPAGAQQVTGEMDKLGKSAKSAGESISIGLKPDAFNNAAKGAHGLGDALKQVGAASKESGEASEKSIISHKEAHESIKALGLAAGDALGPIGELGHFLGNPELLGVAGAILAFKMLTEGIEEMVKNTQKWLDLQRQVKDEANAAHEEAMENMRAEQAAFALKLAHQLDGEDKIKQAIAARLKLQESDLDQTLKLGAAESTRLAKYIDFLVSIGRLNPVQGQEIKQAGARLEADLKDRAEEQKQALELTALLAKRHDAGARSTTAEGNLPSAQAALASAKNLARDHADELKREQDKLTKMDNAAAEQEDRAALVKHIHQVRNDPNATAMEKVEAVAAATKMTAEESLRGMSGPDDEIRLAKSLRAAAETERGRVNSLTTTGIEDDTKVQAAKAAVDRWEKQIEDANQALADLTTSINELHATMSQTRSQHQQDAQGRVADDMADLFTKNAGRGIDTRSADIFNQGVAGNLDVGATLSQLIDEGKNSLASRSSNAIQDSLMHISAIFAAHVQLSQDQQGQIDAIVTKLENMASTIRVQSSRT